MSFQICVPVRARNLKEFLSKITETSKKADIVELWLGDLDPGELDFEKIFAQKKKPYLLNVKGPQELGHFNGSNQQKLNILLEGACHGAEYCDLDYKFPRSLIKKFIQNKGKTDLILTAHYFEHTPPLKSLLNTGKKMKYFGADIIKIAAMAKNHSDLLTIPQLAEKMEREKERFIAISMGEYGKLSRLATPMMGGEMMFASFEQNQKTADGQLTLLEMIQIRNILEEDRQ